MDNTEADNMQFTTQKQILFFAYIFTKGQNYRIELMLLPGDHQRSESLIFSNPDFTTLDFTQRIVI